MDLLTHLGEVTSKFLLGILVFGVSTMEITWRCGQCGKVNDTNLVKFCLQWCDHTPRHN